MHDGLHRQHAGPEATSRWNGRLSAAGDGIAFAVFDGVPYREQIVHWTLSQADRRLICLERATHGGSECLILYQGLPVAVCGSSVPRVVRAWARQARQSWESAGWLSEATDPAAEALADR
ncbi:MAG: hypothetical protein IT176_15545 [Acidobacteria bacterium]|nr:hypothetical protein [Acidobacteriota bacterium]